MLYAPGLRNGDEIRAVCEAVARPVNVLALPGLSMREIVDAGGQRISVGGALTWVAVEAMAAAAERIRDTGDLRWLDRRGARQGVAGRRRLTSSPGPPPWHPEEWHDTHRGGRAAGHPDRAALQALRRHARARRAST